MTNAEFEKLTAAEQEAIWDKQAREARDEFRKVTCVMPASHFAQRIPAK